MNNEAQYLTVSEVLSTKTRKITIDYIENRHSILNTNFKEVFIEKILSRIVQEEVFLKEDFYKKICLTKKSSLRIFNILLHGNFKEV